KRLWYDDYERRSGLVRFLSSDVTIDALERAQADELGDFVEGPFEVVHTEGGMIVLQRRGAVAAADGSRVPVRVRKTIGLIAARRDPGLTMSIEVANEGSQPIEARLAIEWSLNMLGGGANPEAWLAAGGQRHTFDSKGEVGDTQEVSMGNDGVGIALRSRATPAADACWYSIETISLSEQGFERNHQGTCLLWSWPLRLEPGRSATFGVDMRIATSVDRAEEEGL
ncbi:MAG: alpha-amylase/4-alpha-glucanotransferase domain-containing protein, partial [Chloroflexota bacterium]